MATVDRVPGKPVPAPNDGDWVAAEGIDHGMARSGFLAAPIPENQPMLRRMPLPSAQWSYPEHDVRPRFDFESLVALQNRRASISAGAGDVVVYGLGDGGEVNDCGGWRVKRT